MRRVLPRHSRGRLGSHKAVVTWFSPRAVPVQESVPVWFAAPHSRRQSSSRRSQMSSSCCSESCAEGVASWGPSSRPRGGVALAPSRSSARALRSSSSRVPAGLSLSLGSLLLFLSTGVLTLYSQGLSRAHGLRPRLTCQPTCRLRETMSTRTTPSAVPERLLHQFVGGALRAPGSGLFKIRAHRLPSCTCESIRLVPMVSPTLAAECKGYGRNAIHH